MIGTMYQSHSLPKSYGSYSKSKSSGAGAVTQVALVVLLVLSGGLSLMQLSSRAQVRDLKLHHEAVQEELTYTKNHLHHVEAQLANKEAEYTHLAQEVHQYSAHHSIQELETLRTQKRVADQTLATSQDEVKKLKEELDAAHALIDAYKHHLSDEVASHHQREETWMAVQGEWEKLEQELNAEIDSLRTQLNSAHVTINENAHHHQAHPQHIQAEVQKHDPIYDNLPPAHTQPQHTQHAGTPVPVPVPVPTYNPTPVPVPAPATQHAAPVPVHTTAPVQQQAQQTQQQPAPVPAPAQATNPPHPAEAPHMHHNDHYQHHDATHGQGHEWNNDYNQHWDPHSLYADYPGFVDEHQQAHDAHSTWQHQDDSHNFHHDQAHHDAAHHAAPVPEHTQQHVPLPADTHAGEHAQQHAGQHQQQQHTQQQQQIHTDPHAQHTQQQHTQQQHQQVHQDTHAQQQHQQHHVVDDLAMKLGLGGHYEDQQPEQHGWH